MTKALIKINVAKKKFKWWWNVSKGGAEKGGKWKKQVFVILKCFKVFTNFDGQRLKVLWLFLSIFTKKFFTAPPPSQTPKIFIYVKRQLISNKANVYVFFLLTFSPEVFFHCSFLLPRSFVSHTEIFLHTVDFFTTFLALSSFVWPWTLCFWIFRDVWSFWAIENTLLRCSCVVQIVHFSNCHYQLLCFRFSFQLIFLPSLLDTAQWLTSLTSSSLPSSNKTKKITSNTQRSITGATQSTN